METRPIIQIPLEEYERMVSESEKLRKRVEYLENIRAEYIKKELGLVAMESVLKRPYIPVSERKTPITDDF